MSTSHLRPTHRAVVELGRRISGGEWPVGSRLPGETTLAAELGVGRSAVREAVRELATRGLLRSRQGAGVFVLTHAMPADVANAVRSARFEDVSEVRRIVEVEAAVLAAKRRTSDDLETMTAALDNRHRCSSLSDAEFIDADIAFHAAVVASAHNPVLSELFSTFAPRLREALVTYTRDVLSRESGAEPDAEVHLEVLTAIRKQRPADAGAATRRHLDGQR